MAQGMKLYVIEHLGVFAGMFEQLGITGLIDEALPLADDKRTRTTIGQRVKAMLLYGMGFLPRALYNTPQFFERLPVDRLIGPGLCAEDLNDDALGRALDRISDHGTTELFSTLAFTILKQQGLLGQVNHLDSTSISLFGQYPHCDSDSAAPSFGYSKDQRPDLKQLVVNLVSNGPSGAPLWFESANGNQSDKTAFHATIKAFREQLTQADDFIWVADSALYSKKHLETCPVRWITRVPHSVKRVKELINSKQKRDWVSLADGYQGVFVDSQRAQEQWLLVQSDAATARELATLERKISREDQQQQTQLNALARRRFACPTDATRETVKLAKTLKWHQLKVTPDWHAPEDDKPGYQIKITLERDEKQIAVSQRACGYFMLASNDPNLDASALLSHYKAQDNVERGFRFLKDQDFRLSHVLLKNNKRIDALLMIMTIALLLYNIIQYRITTSMQEHDIHYLGANKKSTQKLSVKWFIFNLKGSVQVIQSGQATYCEHLSGPSKQVLTLLGEEVRRIYFG